MRVFRHQSYTREHLAFRCSIGLQSHALHHIGAIVHGEGVVAGAGVHGELTIITVVVSPNAISRGHGGDFHGTVVIYHIKFGFAVLLAIGVSTHQAVAQIATVRVPVYCLDRAADRERRDIFLHGIAASPLRRHVFRGFVGAANGDVDRFAAERLPTFTCSAGVVIRGPQLVMHSGHQGDFYALTFCQLVHLMVCRGIEVKTVSAGFGIQIKRAVTVHVIGSIKACN